jgi:hypothetical protein
MGALILQLEQTLLIFAGIPLAVILFVAGLVYVGGRKSAKRYRPGRPYAYGSVWFTSAQSAPDEHQEVTQAALPGTPAKAVAVAGRTARSAPGVTGGASDRW